MLYKNRELKHARFWDADGNRKWAVFTFNLPSHNHTYIHTYILYSRSILNIQIKIKNKSTSRKGSNLFLSTRELTHPALSTNCKSNPPLWLVKRKSHLWQLSSAEHTWKWDSQRSRPEAFFFFRLGASISASRGKFQMKKDNIKRKPLGPGYTFFY